MSGMGLAVVKQEFEEKLLEGFGERESRLDMLSEVLKEGGVLSEGLLLGVIERDSDRVLVSEVF